MKALVYLGPNHVEFMEKPKPTILAPTDAIVKIKKTTICGTDLHIKAGHVPAVTPGRILGHEGIGIVDEVGSAVTNFKPGDEVLISCVSSCGKCKFCKESMYAHCQNGGSWILGHLIDGTQAEYVRTPFADNSLYHAPDNISSDSLVLVSDIFPTSFEVGVQSSHVKPGDTVAVIGSGPIGLAAISTVQFYSPSMVIAVDLDDNRLEAAKKFGATHTVNSKDPIAAIAKIKELTGGMGVKVSMECVGYPATWDLAQKVIMPTGHISNLGVHGAPVQFDLQDLWIKNITVSTGLVSTHTIQMLLDTLGTGKIDTEQFITHHFDFFDMMKAYEVFGNAAANNALKVILEVK